MYDMLTKDQLSQLHEILYYRHQGLMSRMFGPDWQPSIEVGAPDWQVLKAAVNENNEIMTAVYAEIQRRREEANADA